MILGLLVASENVHKVYSISSGFLILDIMGIPLKIQNSLEPKFHDAGTFGGFGKRAKILSDIQRIFNTLVASENAETPTRFMFYKYRYI